MLSCQLCLIHCQHWLRVSSMQTSPAAMFKNSFKILDGRCTQHKKKKKISAYRTGSKPTLLKWALKNNTAVIISLVRFAKYNSESLGMVCSTGRDAVCHVPPYEWTEQIGAHSKQCEGVKAQRVIISSTISFCWLSHINNRLLTYLIGTLFIRCIATYYFSK